MLNQEEPSIDCGVTGLLRDQVRSVLKRECGLVDDVVGEIVKYCRLEEELVWKTAVYAKEVYVDESINPAQQPDCFPQCWKPALKGCFRVEAPPAIRRVTFLNDYWSLWHWSSRLGVRAFSSRHSSRTLFLCTRKGHLAIASRIVQLLFRRLVSLDLVA